MRMGGKYTVFFSEEEDSVFCKLCGGLLRKGAQHG